MNKVQHIGQRNDAFSLDADPEFFYRSLAHQGALQCLENAVLQKRGLNLVLGDVGIGKTTFSQVLLKSDSLKETCEFHAIHGSASQSEFQFLDSLCKRLSISILQRSSIECLEAIHRDLVDRANREGKAIVLLIDEGQTLSMPVLEMLRTLVTFEANRHPLLQLIIFSRLEALPKFQRIQNFMDRVHFKYVMNPLNALETREMIRFRLTHAGWSNSSFPFTEEMLQEIFDKTQGYPRRINVLCQQLLGKLANARGGLTHV